MLVPLETENNIGYIKWALCLYDRISFSPGWPQTCYVAEDNLELLILLSLLPQCWGDIRFVFSPGLGVAGDETQGR